jgi:hypothetical protein
MYQGSKIDGFKSYYCEKSENIAVLLYIIYIMTKAQRPNVNDGLGQAKTKQ